jgi:hypothetical protein
MRNFLGVRLGELTIGVGAIILSLYAVGEFSPSSKGNIQKGNYNGYEACAGYNEDGIKVAGIYQRLKNHALSPQSLEVIEAKDVNRDGVFQESEIEAFTREYISKTTQRVDMIKREVAQDGTCFCFYDNPDSLENIFNAISSKK